MLGARKGIREQALFDAVHVAAMQPHLYPTLAYLGSYFMGNAYKLPTPQIAGNMLMGDARWYCGAEQSGCSVQRGLKITPITLLCSPIYSKPITRQSQLARGLAF
jgi:hypothetical protein